VIVNLLLLLLLFPSPHSFENFCGELAPRAAHASVNLDDDGPVARGVDAAHPERPGPCAKLTVHVAKDVQRELFELREATGEQTIAPSIVTRTLGRTVCQENVCRLRHCMYFLFFILFFFFFFVNHVRLCTIRAEHICVFFSPSVFSLFLYHGPASHFARSGLEFRGRVNATLEPRHDPTHATLVVAKLGTAPRIDTIRRCFLERVGVHGDPKISSPRHSADSSMSNRAPASAKSARVSPSPLNGSRRS
jgi:hypothetical protein